MLMEDRLGKSHGAEIPRKSRSLDLKSLYKSEELKGVAKNENLKRKSSVLVDGGGADEKRHNDRKKSRKKVSISSLKNVNSKGSKSLQEVYNGSLSLDSRDSKESKSGFSREVNDGGGLGSILHALHDDALKIPRRKRGTLGRRKVENGDQVLKPVVQDSDDVGNVVDQVGKLISEDSSRQTESSKIKEDNGSRDVKENKNDDLNSAKQLEDGDGHADHSARRLEDKDGHAGHSVLSNTDLSLKKSCSDNSFDNGGASSLKTSLKKRRRKRRGLVHHGKNGRKEAEPSIDTSIKGSDGLHDEEEENLEENAARMLSSRFDPNCTAFSPNGKNSALPSREGLSLLLSSRQDPHGSNYVSGSESASVDTDMRVLRPRKQHKEKGYKRKRRHYYEIFSGDVDSDWVLNRRIKVFWPLDQIWYYGLVNSYDKDRRLHHVKYDDRDEEWINLKSERFKLLLLPSEVPGGKSQRKRSVIREKQVDGEKRELEPSKGKKRELTTEDDSYLGNYMDSDPIISWLARSTRRVKSSPIRALKKKKKSGHSLTDEAPMLTEESANRSDYLDGGSFNREKRKLPSNSTFPNRSSSSGRNEVSVMEKATCSNHSKLPIVYYRRRFHKTSTFVPHKFDDNNNVSSNLPKSDMILAPVLVPSGDLEASNVFGGLDLDEGFQRLDSFKALWSMDNAGLLRLNFSLVESRHFRFRLSFPPFLIHNHPFGGENVWLFHAVFLLQYGKLVTMWPRIQLEMLLVDNIVGLRFLLFEGCLKQAITVVFFILNVFHVLGEQQKYADLQLPVTSISFKLSCIQDFRKQLVFALYNFSEVDDSKWIYLDSMLKKHCFHARQLPLSECTYDNIKAFQNGTNTSLGASTCNNSTSIEGLQRKSRQCINLMGVPRESAYVNASCSSSNSDKNCRYFPPFTISFTAASTFFLGLHLKLLMEHSVDHISLQDHDSVEHPWNSDSLMADDFSSMEDCFKKGSEQDHDNDFKASPRVEDCEGYEPHNVDVSVCSDNDSVKSSPKGVNSGATSSSPKDAGELDSNAVSPLQKWQQCDSSLQPSGDGDKPDTGSGSLMNGITVEILSVNQFDKHVDKVLQGAQQSSDLPWNMTCGSIPSPNPTARRSTWHRSRSAAASFGWSDGKTDFLQNNFSNGPKKPRTQVSYALPLGGFDYSPKNKSHHQKGFLKRIRTPNEKWSSDISRGSERNLQPLSCNANLLITLADRGWRESSAQVVLELFDHNEWKLAVKHSETTKYSYKAHQFLQNWSTNKYTHAMIWKGGKDWMLEFPDRSQWVLFKEMHEECYNRNIRSASVKNIPIPGVRLIEENYDSGSEVVFVRSFSKYFRQVETDVEMALNPVRVLYDMDSDDERWKLKNRCSSKSLNGTPWEISDEVFEKTMSMFEKAAYSLQRDQFTLEEMEEIMTGVGPMEAIKTIYQYWQQKRHKKGMPLIRHLQPPLWERYQQEVKEWELAMNKINTMVPTGCHEKVTPVERPPMFAFCLKPRGLELPNKLSKQRSQKKSSVSGQNYTFTGDHEGSYAYGRRFYGFASGDERHPGYVYGSLDDSRFAQISPRVFSPQDAGAAGYVSMNSDKNNLHKFQRSKSKKLGSFVSPNDTQIVASHNQRMFDKGNGVHGRNMDFFDWPSRPHYHFDGPLRRSPEELDGTDLDGFRLHDASGAAKNARNTAKLKREKARWLFSRADLAIHKAVVALMMAEAIKVSSAEVNDDG